jgi:F-type H+-transporting ATPase subunit gamma
MANLRDIRRRINSVKNTQKITRAMKMVAAAKLRRAQESVVRARPYAYQLRELVSRVALRTEGGEHPLLRHGTGDTIGIIVVTSDRGLCGSFNSSIVNETLRLVDDEFKGQPVELTVIGRKGVDAFKRRGLTIRNVFVNVDDGNLGRVGREIIHEAVEHFLEGGTKSVYCIYNEFKSAISQRVLLERVLPFEVPETEQIVVDYLYEPSQEAVLGTLLERDMAVQMRRILFESAASEQGARMTAMEAATSNAGDMIDRLTLSYNQARQAAITSEMLEIISGADAL